VPITFRQAVEAAMDSGDPASLADVLADDVVFRSPAVFKPYEGKETVLRMLTFAASVFEDFEYVDELHGDRTHGYVFRARVGAREIDGWDYVTYDTDGKVSELRVMVRPFSALQALMEEMGRRIEAASAAAE
jgi:hypothetical protein